MKRIITRTRRRKEAEVFVAVTLLRVVANRFDATFYAKTFLKTAAVRPPRACITKFTEQNGINYCAIKYQSFFIPIPHNPHECS